VGDWRSLSKKFNSKLHVDGLPQMSGCLKLNDKLALILLKRLKYLLLWHCPPAEKYAQSSE